MKRVQVSPGRFVYVPDELIAKAKQAFANAPTREQIETAATLEPAISQMLGPRTRRKKGRAG
jgi:hypothetical protein